MGLRVIGRFSSLYIGILAATEDFWGNLRWWIEFQFPLHRDPRCNEGENGKMGKTGRCFSSLYIGILAATEAGITSCLNLEKFQFPLHRDPRCNPLYTKTPSVGLEFQFPLHRDPRCNANVRVWIMS